MQSGREHLTMEQNTQPTDGIYVQVYRCFARFHSSHKQHINLETQLLIQPNVYLFNKPYLNLINWLQNIEEWKLDNLWFSQYYRPSVYIPSSCVPGV